MTENTTPALQIQNQTLDAERALYHLVSPIVTSCSFDGPADGESALKECTDVQVDRCFFNLRYPLWHCNGARISDSEMTNLCRAPLWYCQNVHLSRNHIHGVKALRECRHVTIEACDIQSTEFGWSVRDIQIQSSKIEGEYLFLRAKDLRVTSLHLLGKYSLQYVKGATLTDCTLDTKDAFWHAKRVVVRDSVIRGEYLGWYAEDITFERCRIIGTQPLCYCKNLTMIDCEMVDADLAFEKSSVQATLTAPIDSIKNPLSGCITLPSVGEIIREDKRYRGEILVTG